MKKKQVILIGGAMIAVALCIGTAAFLMQQEPVETVPEDDSSTATSMVTDELEEAALPENETLEQEAESTASSEDVQEEPLEDAQETSEDAEDIADAEDAASAVQTSTRSAGETSSSATAIATTEPTATPTVAPTQAPVATAIPTAIPTTTPTATPVPTAEPTAVPVADYSTIDCAAIETAIYNQMNALRTASGLPALSYNGSLATVADLRANETIVSYSHTRPDGSKYYTAYNACGYTGYSFAGENISRVLASSYSATADSIATALYQSWYNSATHLANMLDGDFTQVGIGVVYNAADGKFYAVQNFA